MNNEDFSHFIDQINQQKDLQITLYRCNKVSTFIDAAYDF